VINESLLLLVAITVMESTNVPGSVPAV